MSTSGQTDMTAGSRKKFLFDTDFTEDEVVPVIAPNAQPGAEPDADGEQSAVPAPEDEPEVVEEAPPPPTYSEEELAQARAEGMKAGRDEATRDMTSAMEQRLANTMDAINAQITSLFDAYDQDKEEHSRDAVAVAAVIVRKLFPAMNMDKAMNEIEHMIKEAMKRTSGVSTLMIRVPQDIAGEIEAKTAEMAASRGREGALSVTVDESMAAGDVAVEWEGGGMIRDTQFIWGEIDEIIERNLGKKLDDYVPEQAEDALETEQLVVNPAQVGENEANSAESPQTQSDNAPNPEQKLEPEQETGDTNDEPAN